MYTDIFFPILANLALYIQAFVIASPWRVNKILIYTIS